MTDTRGLTWRAKGSPQVLHEHDENIKELIDQVQGEQLRALLGPRLAAGLAPRLHASVSQVGHPQSVQQGDYAAEQRGLQKPEAKEEGSLSVPSPLLTAAG